MLEGRLKLSGCGTAIMLVMALVLVSTAYAEEVIAPQVAPVAVCRSWGADADCGGGAYVYVEDIDDGSYDPDGYIDDICIVAVDGSPVGCQYSVYLSPPGTYNITIRVTDDEGAVDECTETFTVQNQPPVAECQLFAEKTYDTDECIWVSTSDIDAASYDPDGHGIDMWIVAIDGAPVPPSSGVEVCGVGEHTVTMRVEDCVGASDECHATVWVTNNDPWITCQDYTAHIEPDGCAYVNLYDVLDSYDDPDGISDIDQVCIVAVDGDPAFCVGDVDVCGLGSHTVTLAVWDIVGAYDECTANVEVFNNTPVAVCVDGYAVPAEPGGCVMVYASDLDDGSYDPDGDLYDVCIGAVDGVPTDPCEYSVEICVGTHTLTLRAVDEFGAYDECDVTVEVINQPPVAQCRSFSEYPDFDCCLTVAVDDIDDGSYDPDGPGDIAFILITHVDGVDVGGVTEHTVCGEGDHEFRLMIQDTYGLSDDCLATVTVMNTPPEAYCQPYDDHGDEGCCITVHWTDIDDFSGDPDGNMERIRIVEVDGTPYDWVESVEICGQGIHSVRLGIEDACGQTDYCETDVEITNTPPIAQCRYYGADGDEGCCIMVGVDDIDDGSYDPDGSGDIESLLITGVDGSPVTPTDMVEICGQGMHTVELTITDYCGEYHSCLADVEVINHPPVAVCMDHTGYADEFCCITVGVDSIDGGSYDPDGPGDIESLCITAIDGTPVGCEQEVEICGVGTYAVTLTITDWCGETDQCDATVDLVDITPPEIEVELNRYTLWPPNHKMADIVATVEATDNCDPDPAITLVSITSNEPDNNGGDGDTDGDIQGAAFGTEDYEFQLRSERSGKRLGRIYTIVYRATDFSGNSTDATVYVRVPHNQPGLITATTGFTGDGTGFSRSHDQFTVVVMSQLEVYGINHNGKVMLVETMFDATQLDLTKTYVGNTMGVLLPERSEEVDQNGDGMMDLALWYDIASVEPLVENISQGQIGEVWIADPIDPVGVHYQSASGVDYLVDDIFELGAPENLGGGSSAGVGDTGKVTGVTRLFPVEPNPFSASTTIRFSLVREEQVALHIYDARGMLVKTLEDRLMPSGQHQVVWDGTDNLGRRVAAGVYFTRFAAGAYRATEKTMFLR
jgi:hypothetical protein